jgi:putative membrane protein
MLKKYLGSFFYRLVHWIVSALALMITAKLLTGFAVDTFVTAMIAAVVLAVANAIIRPILLFFTLPTRAGNLARNQT